jgi:hypothetical protein
MNTDSTGRGCDSTTQSCVDPTQPTEREEALQESLPEDERHLPPASFAAPATPPPPPPAPPGPHVIAPPPPVSPTDYTLYVPQGALYSAREDAIREVDNSDNAWYVRSGFFVLGLLATPVALAEEYVARPIMNVPFAVHNAGIGIGEHAGRAYLWSQQGETGEATVEVLEGVVSFSHGFVAAGSVAIPVAGALESRAVGVTTTIVESEVSSTAATGENSVYQSLGSSSEVNYVGITNDIERRAAEHLRTKGIAIREIPGLSGLSRADARAVEQVLIETHGLGRNGGTLINKINSIAASNPNYAAALQRGGQLLHQAGYPGF